MNNARRKSTNATVHTHVTATAERKQKVVDEFAAQEQPRRDYNEQVAAGNAERELARQIAAGEREPDQSALHDDDHRGVNVQSYDPQAVRVVGSGGRHTGGGWGRLAKNAFRAIQIDAGSTAERNHLDPDSRDHGQPAAKSIAKFGPGTPPPR